MSDFKGRKYTVGDLLGEDTVETPAVDLGGARSGPRSGPFVAGPTDVYPPGGSPRGDDSRAVFGRIPRTIPTRVGAVMAAFGVALGLCCSVPSWIGGADPVSQFGPVAPVAPAPSVVTVTVPGPAVTVTETQSVVVGLPQTCWDAIHQAGKLLDDASAIASAGNRARDLISQAYQAALMGDTVKLNKAAQGLMDLDSDLASHNSVVLPPWQSIMDGLATCQEN